MAVDFTNTVVESLIAVIPSMVNDGLVPTDPAYLKSMVRRPLQDDPTLRAFFLTIEPDRDAGFRKQVSALSNQEITKLGPIPDYEIGGGFLMVNWFSIEGWTPRRKNADENATLVGQCYRNLETALARLHRNAFFAGITTDDGNESSRGLINVFNSLERGFHPIGGETERYNSLWYKFAIFSEVNNAFWG